MTEKPKSKIDPGRDMGFMRPYGELDVHEVNVGKDRFSLLVKEQPDYDNKFIVINLQKLNADGLVRETKPPLYVNVTSITELMKALDFVYRQLMTAEGNNNFSSGEHHIKAET